MVRRVRIRLEISAPDAHAGFSANFGRPGKVDVPDPFVERGREGAERAVEGSAGVGMGEGGGAARMGENGEVGKPESGELVRREPEERISLRRKGDSSEKTKG